MAGNQFTRREALEYGAMTAGILIVGGAAAGIPARKPKSAAKEPEVSATEDLMREHGVLRRILLAYREVAPRLRAGAAVDAAALHQAADLFKTFGETYHEQMLEEQHIFPVVKKMKDRASGYVEILESQHARGREITAYILSATAASKIASANEKPLADAFESFVRMYEHHAAREDTIVFPAWKKNFTNKQLDEISDQFEDIEHKMFGKDGFEDAEARISHIEEILGLANLAQFTAPKPR